MRFILKDYLSLIINHPFSDNPIYVKFMLNKDLDGLQNYYYGEYSDSVKSVRDVGLKISITADHALRDQMILGYRWIRQKSLMDDRKTCLLIMKHQNRNINLNLMKNKIIYTWMSWIKEKGLFNMNLQINSTYVIYQKF